MAYEVTGNVRGNCGHTHRSLKAAIACLVHDRSGCKAQGGYSDRRLYDENGDQLEIYRDADGVWRAYSVPDLKVVQ